jgi:hypothetical protein
VATREPHSSGVPDGGRAPVAPCPAPPPGAERGFALPPRRWVAERSLARAARCRGLARGHERPPGTVRGLTSPLPLASCSAASPRRVVRHSLQSLSGTAGGGGGHGPRADGRAAGSDRAPGARARARTLAAAAPTTGSSWRRCPGWWRATGRAGVRCRPTTGPGTASTDASPAGAGPAFGPACSRRSPPIRCSTSWPPTPPSRAPTSTPPGQRGGRSGPRRRSLARRPEHQDPLGGRRARPAGASPADAGAGAREYAGRGASGRPAGRLCRGRPGLRLRPSRRGARGARRHGRHPATLDLAPVALVSRALQAAQPRRARHRPPEAVPARRHPPRRDGAQLRRLRPPRRYASGECQLALVHDLRPPSSDPCLSWPSRRAIRLTPPPAPPGSLGCP